MPVECPKCHSENNDNSRFCSNCAAPLGVAGAADATLTRTLEAPVQVMKPGSLVAGKYKILEEIGQGGMGIVYKAEDIKLKRCVALKFLPPHLMDSPELKERFLVEAQAAAALNHPNICVIYEIGESSEHPYIAMEYVEGETLRDKVKKGPLKAEEALTIASQVAAGLGEAHRKGIIHRDIKSANIMVTAKGQAKVMDFGLAKLQGGSSLTKSQTTLGTVAYMSPEQARGDELDQRTDLWSLGVVLYEMLTATMPFRGDHDQAVIYAILHHEPEPLKKLRAEVPAGLDEIVGQSLAKKPADRYRTMEELREDVEAVAEGLKPLKARPRRRARKILGIRTAYVYAGLTVAIALALGLDVGGLRDRILGKPGASARAVRLAVLPFTNLTGDPQQEFFSDGLTQQMNAQLGGLNPQALSVIGNASVARYKNTSTPIDQIGRELGVEYVLEGGAQREGARVRITAELIKTRDQTQIWAETFDQEASSLLTLQSQVAQKVAGALALKLLPAEQASLAKIRTIDPAAYEAYLKGSQYWIKMTPGDLDTAEKYFDVALQKQPDYAAAYTGLAWVWACRNQMTISPSSEAVPKAKAAALKAVELDDSLAEAHYALASVTTWHDWDIPKADAEWRRAVALNPSYADGLAMYSHYLMIVGRPDEAMAMIKKALDLDPFNVTIHSFYVVDLIFARRYDDAIAEGRATLAMQPDNPVATSGLGLAYILKGMDKEAFAWLKQNYPSVEMQAALDKGFAEAGFRGAARHLAVLEESLAGQSSGRGETTFASGPGNISPYDVALNYSYAQDKEQALKWLERCYEVKEPNLPYLRWPIFDFLRSDPRFQDLMRRMKLLGGGK
jgi:TolB-like protein/tRNA A-37 threonylcarbamoyl transferase component Bud32/Tfp pilus assembly protein PilF